MATGAISVHCNHSLLSPTAKQRQNPCKWVSTKTVSSTLTYKPTSHTQKQASYIANACSQWDCGIALIVARSSFAAVVAAALCFVDPALAFKGGGPYGAEVTRGADLSGKDFSGKTLVQQDFKTSILRQAKFKGAKLLGASFFDADLTGADLSDADLRGVDFSLANVTKANLSNANLEGALVTGNTSFKGSNINGADFTDVPLRDDQRRYLCNIADGVNTITGNATRDTLLC